jgi:hypothetical protein
MTTIVTRITNPTGGTAKGTPLTSAEIDQNFINLNDNKLEITDLVTTNTADKGVKRDGSGNFAAGTITAVGVTITTNGLGVTAGGISVTAGNITAAASNTKVNALGVGVDSPTTTGEIRAADTITSYYSDERLKTNIESIPNALDKVMELRGVTYNSNKLAESFGFKNKEKQVGVLAGDVEKVLPEAVKPAPFDIMLFENTEISKSGANYKTVQYEKLVPLLIEAIKELNNEIKQLKEIK